MSVLIMTAILLSVVLSAVSGSSTSTRFNDLGVVCLGCSSGIGRSTAEYLAAGGAKVVACSRKTEKFEWISSGNFTASIYPTRCDAADIESMYELLRFSVDTLGAITGLVYVPTYLGDPSDPNTNKPLHAIDLDFTLSYADKQFAIDYKGYVAAVRIFLDELRKTERGSVVAISSIASEMSFIGSFNQNLNYGAVKNAQQYAMKSFAKTFAHIPIRFNSVSPGVTDTPTYDGFGAEIKKQLFNDFSLHIPMMRVADSVEMAQSVAFLLSNEARYITGVVLKVDGGFSLRSGLDGQTVGNPEAVIEDVWRRWIVDPDFDLETKSMREKSSECGEQ